MARRGSRVVAGRASNPLAARFRSIERAIDRRQMRGSEVTSITQEVAGDPASQPSSRRVRTSTDSMSDGDPLDFPTDEYDDLGVFVNATTATLQSAGRYVLRCYANIDATTATRCAVVLEVNGSVVSAQREQRPSSSEQFFVSHEDEMALAAGDDIQWTVGSDSSGGFDCLASSMVIRQVG